MSSGIRDGFWLTSRSSGTVVVNGDGSDVAPDNDTNDCTAVASIVGVVVMVLLIRVIVTVVVEEIREAADMAA